jgi:tetratricopeptide (TPR) repeat protein
MGLLPVVLIGVVAFLLREGWVNLVLPGMAEAARERGNTPEQRRLLEQVIATRTLFGGLARADARYRLAWCAMEEGRYEVGAEFCRAALRERLPRSFEAHVRRRLADCLEGTGDPEAAREQREKAEALIGQGTTLPDLIARGQAALEQRRFAEACTVYEQALPLVPHWNRELQGELHVRLALASFEAGRAEQAARWGESALGLPLSADMAITAHSMAAIGYSNRGLLEEAEAHLRKGFELAKEAGNRDRAAKCLVQLAGIQARRGELVLSIQACTEALQLSLHPRHSARLMEGEALRRLGRFDEARSTFEQGRQAVPQNRPASVRRQHSLFDLAQIEVEVETGRWQAAAQRLEAVRPELEGEPKLRVWLLGYEAWVLAHRGDHDAARERLVSAEAASAALPDDPGTVRMLLSTAGLTRVVLGDPNGALRCWEQFLTLRPDPVDVPDAYCHIGEIHLSQGRVTEARVAFEHAVAPKIECHWGRRAARHLRELGGAEPPGGIERTLANSEKREQEGGDSTSKSS